MRAVVFSGTTEGRIFSRQLAQLGADVLVSVATPLGSEEQGSFAGITVHCGRLTPDEMAALVQRQAIGIENLWRFFITILKEAGNEIDRSRNEDGVSD